MRLDTLQPHAVTLTVSRRNLLTLLGKVDNALSAKTLAITPPPGVLVKLIAEPDDEHYEDRPSAGIVRIDPAAVLAIAQDLIEQTAEAVSEHDEFRASALDMLAFRVGYQRERVPLGLIGYV